MRLAGLILVLAVLVTAAHAQQRIENTRHGFTIEIPEDWHEIPPASLGAFARAVSTPERRINYVAGFQRDPFEDEIVYPFILIQLIPYRDFELDRPPTREKMTAIVESILGTSIPEALPDQLSELIEDEPRIVLNTFDDTNGTVIYDLNLRATSVGEIRGRARGLFGRHAYIQPVYFSLASNWPMEEARANRMLESFEYSPGYDHPMNSDAQTIDTITMESIDFGSEQRAKSWATIGAGLILVAIAAVAFALIMRAIDRRS